MSQIKYYASVFFIIASPVYGEIYSWKDEHGNTVYGDAPEKTDNAKAIDLQPTTILGFPTKDQNPDVEDTEDTSQASNTLPYTEIKITQPIHEATVRDNTGNISVNASLQPSLQAGHLVQFRLNGQAYGKPQSTASTTLNNIDRGEHQISAQVLNQTGQILKQSEPITVYLHRFRVAP